VKKHETEDVDALRGRDSEIEEIVKAILEKHSIPYNKHKKFGKFFSDFILEEFNLIIECDGLFWHSDGCPDPKNKKYHLSKKEEYEKRELFSFFFREDEIKEKTDIVESMILNKLNKSSKIPARKTELRKV